MQINLEPQGYSSLRTACGREFGHAFKAIKLVRDEQHNFHIIYKTFSNEYIYSFCNPFQDTLPEHAYKLISEEQAKSVFMGRLSQENARELFNTAQAPAMQIHS